MSFIECHFGEDYVIVQRGHGGLVLVIIYLCLFIMEWGTKIFFHDSNYYQQHKWPRLIAFLELRHWFGSYLAQVSRHRHTTARVVDLQQ